MDVEEAEVTERAGGSIDNFKPAAGDLRDFFGEEDFAETPAAVIGITDGCAKDDVSLSGDGGRSSVYKRML
jgi:hypothetical protein